MLFRAATLALLLLLSCAHGTAWAQAGANADPNEQLVVQARYWETRGRYDLARETWLKLLRADPDSASALSGLAYSEARSNRPAAAQVYLDRLREASPDHPEIRRIEGAIRQGSFDQERLAVPRGLARQGRYEEAIEAYQDVFGNEIPDGRLGLEYYQTLAGAPNGWEPARRGIQTLVEDYPDEPLYKLALGQHLTYREESRRSGISRLAEIADEPAVAEPVQQAWRQALIWLNAKPGDDRYYQTYIRRYGNDNEVQSRYNGLVVAGEVGGVDAPDPRVAALSRAYETLNTGDLQAAAVQFREIVEKWPADEEGLAGLGIVRLRQQRFADARELLQQAIQIAPKKARKWSEALETARFWEQVRLAEAERGKGNPEAAEAGLRKALALEPKGTFEPSVRSTLADIMTQLNRFDDAEVLYKQILAREPEYMDAVRGLFGILAREEGRIEEAVVLAESLPPDLRQQIPGLQPLKAKYYRNLATAALEGKDDASAERFLKDALLLDPNSPWIRMDLARMYQRQKRTRDANTLIDGILSANPRMPDALYIKALLLSEQQRWYEGLQLLERIALDARNQGMADLQRRLWVRYQTERAAVLARFGRPDVARRILREVEPNHGGQSELLGALATGWAEVGEEGRALRFMREALSATSVQTAGLRLQYAALLFKLRQDAEFEVVVEDLVSRSDFTEQEALDLANLRVAYRLRQADLVREDGELARAYEYLQPLLQVNPNDPRLLMALARLYNDAKEFDRTLEIYQRVLAADASNLDAYKGAIGAALALNQNEQAAGLLDQAFALDPSNPRLYALAGRLARARGEDGRALEYFQQALDLDNARGNEEFGGDGRFAPQLELLDPQNFALEPVGGFPGESPVYRSDYDQTVISPQEDLYYYEQSVPLDERVVAPLQAEPYYYQSTQPSDSQVPPYYYDTQPQQLPRVEDYGYQETQPGQTVTPYVYQSEPGSAGQGYYYEPQQGSGPGGTRYVQPGEIQDGAYEEDNSGSGVRRYDAYPASWNGSSSGAKVVLEAGSASAAALKIALAAGPPAKARLWKVSTPARNQAPPATYEEPEPQVVPEAYQRRLEQRLYPPPQQQPARSLEPQRIVRQPAGRAPAFSSYPVEPVGVPVQLPLEQNLSREVLSIPYGPVQQGPVAPRRIVPQPRRQEVQPVVLPRNFETELGGESRFRRDVQREVRELTRQQPVVIRQRDPVLEVPEFARRRSAEPINRERRDLMREIRDIRAKRSAFAGVGIAFRNREGQEGLSQLLNIEVPAEFSFPGTTAGRFKLRATPVFLNAGTVAGSELPFFGTLALVDDQSLSFGQDASGVALGLIYDIGELQLDVSSSPLGFPIESLVGGLKWEPQVDNFRYRLDLSRRHVTDSLLSYAGTFEPGLAVNWGGVYKTGGRLDVAYDLGDYGAYVNGSYHVVDGTNVDTNSVLELGGGFYARGVERPGLQVTYGINVTSFFFEKNRRRFTYGHGGYFSPQFYLALGVPVEVRGNRDRFSYKLNGSVGLQAFREDGAPFYPTSSALQTALVEFAADNPELDLTSSYPSQSSSGLGYTFSGQMEYLIAPTLSAGAVISLDNARDFNESLVFGFLKYWFSPQRLAHSPPDTIMPHYNFGDPNQ